MRAIAGASALGLATGCAIGGAVPEGPELADTEVSGSSGTAGPMTSGPSMTDDGAPSTGESDAGYDSSGDPVPEGCGDGERDPDEECDDGNNVNADGCNNDCQYSGRMLWSDTFGSGFGFVEDGFSVAASSDGTVFLSGYQTNAAEGRDAWLRRYSADGEALWTQSHAGPGGGNDEIRGLLLDDGNNLYALGYHSTETTGLDAWIRSYNLQGGEVWTRTYNGPASGTDVFHAASFDAIGNLVVGGYQGVAGEGADVLLRKYSVDGDVLWTRTYSPGNGGNDLIWDVATSPAGHVYVAGYESGTVGEGLNAWLAKYDTDGNVIWTRAYNGAASQDDFFIGVEVVGDDDVVVCGYETAVDYPWHSFVRRYDRLGMIMWTDEFQGTAGEGAHCFGIAVDSQDHLVTVGGELAAGIRGVMVRKYDLDGTVRWSRVVPGGDVGPDYGRRIAFGPDDTITVAGAINSGADDRDIWVGVFTP